MARIKKSRDPLLAHKNEDFLHGPGGREVRVLSEFLAPGATFEKYGINHTIAFFGSARTLSVADVQKKIREEKKKMGKRKTKRLVQLEALKRVAFSYDDARELGRMLSEWSRDQEENYTIVTGGGPGIMEAGNRGAYDAKAPSIGLNINLPFEQHPNPFITDELNMQFHYFFIRKYWFLYMAKALVAFPGGFGTLDEFFEVVTLVQTNKLEKKFPIVLYSEEFWRELVNFDLLVELGMIEKKDLDLFTFCNTPEEAYDVVTKGIIESAKTVKKSRSQDHTVFSDLWDEFKP